MDASGASPGDEHWISTDNMHALLIHQTTCTCRQVNISSRLSIDINLEDLVVKQAPKQSGRVHVYQIILLWLARLDPCSSLG